MNTRIGPSGRTDWRYRHLTEFDPGCARCGSDITETDQSGEWLCAECFVDWVRHHDGDEEAEHIRRQIEKRNTTQPSESSSCGSSVAAGGGAVEEGGGTPDGLTTEKDNAISRASGPRDRAHHGVPEDAVYSAFVVLACAAGAALVLIVCAILG